MQIGNLGLHSSNTFYAARERALLPRLVANSVLVSLGTGALTGLGLWIVFSIWPRISLLTGLLFALALLWIPFGIAYALLQGLLIGIEDFRGFNRIEILTKAVGLGLIAPLILFHALSPESALGVGLASLILGVVLVLLRLRPHLHEAPKPSLDVLRSNARYGLKAYLAAFFAFAVLRADLLMVRHMLGPEPAGYYSVATALGELVLMIGATIGSVLFPRLSATPDDEAKWQLTKRAVLAVVLAMVPVAAAAVLLADPLIRVLFGGEFSPATAAFASLMPGVLFLGIQVVAVQFLNSLGFPKEVVVVWACALGLNILLNFHMIPAYGIVGASVTASLTYFIVFLGILVIIARRIYAERRIAQREHLRPH
jgi:O-antigen/teichoic acid export membrane protein